MSIMEQLYSLLESLGLDMESSCSDDIVIAAYWVVKGITTTSDPCEIIAMGDLAERRDVDIALDLIEWKNGSGCKLSVSEIWQLLLETGFEAMVAGGGRTGEN